MSRFDKIERAEIEKIAKRAAPAAGSSGVTDHGALTGLNDDDHSHYYNQTRGDARYSQLGHTHTASNITDIDERIQDVIGAALDGGSAIPVTYDDATGTISLDIGIHQHAAGDITSGTISTARLGSGGAGNLKFLNGASEWSFPFSIPRVQPLSGFREAAPIVGDALTTMTLTASTAYYVPYRCHKSFSINAVGLNVSTAVASSTAAVAVYDSDDNGWPVGAPLVTSGTITTATLGDRTAAVSLTLDPGKQYWLGCQAPATSPPTLRAMAVGSGIVLMVSSNAANQMNLIRHTGVVLNTWRNFTSSPVTTGDLQNGTVPLVFMVVV